MKTTLITTIYFIFLNLSSIYLSQAQFIAQEEIKGFTTASDVIILRDYSETKGLIELGEAYSKARGVTIFSAMNALNSRAKKKLLEEASARGASHVWITERLPDDAGMFGRLVSYNAVFYRKPENKIDISQVKKKITETPFKNSVTFYTDRNNFGAKTKYFIGPVWTILNTEVEIFEKNNRVYIQKKVIKAARNISEIKTYEVIGIGKEKMLLSLELEKDKKYGAHLFEPMK
ncbi:MAG: hypothetical protein ACXIUQ_05120 [Cecembia sp.]